MNCLEVLLLFAYVYAFYDHFFKKKKIITGQAASEELIRNTLSAVEAISQHPVLLSLYHCTVSICTTL